MIDDLLVEACWCLVDLVYFCLAFVSMSSVGLYKLENRESTLYTDPLFYGYNFILNVRKVVQLGFYCERLRRNTNLELY